VIAAFEAADGAADFQVAKIICIEMGEPITQRVLSSLIDVCSRFS